MLGPVVFGDIPPKSQPIQHFALNYLRKPLRPMRPFRLLAVIFRFNPSHMASKGRQIAKVETFHRSVPKTCADTSRTFPCLPTSKPLKCTGRWAILPHRRQEKNEIDRKSRSRPKAQSDENDSSGVVLRRMYAGVLAPSRSGPL